VSPRQLDSDDVGRLDEPAPLETFARWPKARGECWPWVGAISRDGYGRLGRDYAHRAAWEFHRGPIPLGWWIDHLCRNRVCVNPDHLEPVPPAVNILRGESPSARHARQTHCVRGHPLDGENLYRWRGRRQCRECRRDRQRRRAA
jgi:hypothetical protein